MKTYKAIIVGAIIIGISLIVVQYLRSETIINQQYAAEQIQWRKEEREYSDELIRQANIDACIGRAERLYAFDWDFNCEKAGKQENCSLLTSIATDLTDSFQKNKDICIKRY